MEEAGTCLHFLIYVCIFTFFLLSSPKKWRERIEEGLRVREYTSED